MSHEVVCLSSDEDENTSFPIIVSTVSVAGMNSAIEIPCDDEETPNGNSEHTKKESSDEDVDDAVPSTSSTPPPDKKRRVDLITLSNIKSNETPTEISPKRKSRQSLLLEENRKLFEQFLTKCEELENSSDMKKGIGKAHKHYETTQKEYLISTELKELLEKFISKVSKTCVWGYLGDLVKQFKLYKEVEGNLTGSQKERDLQKEHLAANDKEKYYDVLKSEENEEKVAKLQSILRKIHRKIAKLEATEVDFDDENDSVYIMTERFKARAAKVYDKLCQYTNLPADAERVSKRKMAFSGTDIPAVNKCIERFVNKNNCFPDYQDVLKLINTVNSTDNLNIRAEDIRSIATQAFRELGRLLKRRRQWDVEDTLYAHLDRGDFRPEDYENDAGLEAKLEENGKVFVQKFNEVIEKFTNEQIEKSEKAENGDKNGNGEKGSSSENTEGEQSDNMVGDQSEGEDDDETEEEATDNEEPIEDALTDSEGDGSKDSAV